MTIIWGFNLSKMHCSAFRSANMFDRQWYLRRERFVVYQLAMVISLAAECTATYSLSKYEKQQENIAALSSSTALVHNNDLIDSAITTIVFCVLVATLFGAEFFFALFFPARAYPAWYHAARGALALVITGGMAAAAVASTAIIARRTAWISGVSPAQAQAFLDVYSRPPLVYRHFPQNIAWVALLWPALLLTALSTWLMFAASAHDRRYGPAPIEKLERGKDGRRDMDMDTDMGADTGTIRA